MSLISGLHAQEISTSNKSKKILATRDTIKLEKTSINSNYFKILDAQTNVIDSSYYKINFEKSTLIFSEKFMFSNDSLTVEYVLLPNYLTKEYSIYDDSRVVENGSSQNNLYKVTNEGVKKFSPFDGLSSTGSISRGITIGNNQNAVVNSNLDLQITGKLSDKVSLRASIQDSNIQLENGGYSQTLDEFDQIFIELFSDTWNIRAGDLTIENRQNQFLNFSKKVQGLSANFNFGPAEKKTNIFAAASLVRGEYCKSTFTGSEGNQGPYKLLGANGELYILVISGTERVYVNGILLERGDNKDYIINYNAGEVSFTSLFPITSEMRISIEYQYTDNSYTTFLTYFGGSYTQKKFSISANVYSETDLKNQPIQENLSSQQIDILAAAGDNTQLMVAPSAYVDSFSENRSNYKKIIIDGQEVYEFSSVPEDVLYNVTFTLVGNNLGDYILTNSTAVGKIYEYVPPKDGVKQGNYAPIIQLTAPQKTQVATVMGSYNPSEKTIINYEIGVSNFDQNLFSTKDDQNNEGLAAKINAKQQLYKGKFNAEIVLSDIYVQQNFKPLERLFNIEFERDWNLNNSITGNLNLLSTGVNLKFENNGYLTYLYENLNFKDNYNGSKNILKGLYTINNWSFQTLGSYLASTGTTDDSKFLRDITQARYHYKNNWIGASIRLENNQQKTVPTNLFTSNSQKFIEYGAFLGRGDSTRVYAETGYLFRTNDSLQNGLLRHVNNSQSIYFKSRLIQNDNTNLSVFLNYRNLKYTNSDQENEPSLNSNIIYTSGFFNQFIQSTTTFETSSGTIQQQEFTFLEVEPGKGVYTWIDYNENGVQELQEFEIAAFSDQAKFVLVFLPNQIFVKTHQNKFSESLTFNTSKWFNQVGLKKFLSYFYDQASFLINRKIIRDGDNFDLNPFDISDENLLGLNSSFRNSLFYNRGKQDHSVTYTFLINDVKNLLSVGSQENTNKSHQLLYQHLYKKSWLFSMAANIGKTVANVENYSSRDYEIDSYLVAPKISYIFSRNVSWDVFCEFQNKENKMSEFQTLKQTRIGTSFTYSGEKKLTMNGEFSLYENNFTGNAFTPVAFQMLSGLQPGKNATWRLLIQKNITQFLDINLNYQGRKSEIGEVINTGSVQLRAYF